MGRKRHELILWVGIIAAAGVSGCGYSLQTSENSDLEKRGIHKIYIAPIANSTYKPGVENWLYNEVVKTFSARRQVKIVSHVEDADAVLRGQVTGASYIVSGSTGAQDVFPANVGSPFQKQFRALPNIATLNNVPTEYSSSMACSFQLESPKKKPTDKTTAIWSGSFNRDKPFPGNNQLGVFGTTGPLINESEFDRTLQELSVLVSYDLHEAVLTLF